MRNNLQNSDQPGRKTTGEGLLGEGAEKYIRDSANIVDLPGDDEDLEIDDDEEEVKTVQYNYDADDIETELADKNSDGEEEHTNKDEVNKELLDKGLRS